MASASGVFLPHDPRTPLPTYQYRCTECDHAFEEFQSFTDDALTVCPVCGGRLRKVFNAVGVVFKGSGFYRNDSRAKDTVGSASSKDGSSGSESTTSSASTSGSADSGSGSSSSSSSTATTSSTSTSSTTAGSAAGS